MSKKISRTSLIFIGLFLLGAGMRIFGAWAFAPVHTADRGIINLMVKHTMEGRELPVFFYGLPYMGSLEPLVSLILCVIFGTSDFMINMGTALFGILLLPAVYVWGKRAGGVNAGLAAMAFCTIGPEFYFQFMSWADGGYAAIVLFTALLIPFGLDTFLLTRNGAVPTKHWLGLGLLAGVGWWLSPLLISSYLTLALLGLLILKEKLFWKPLFLAAPAFVVGATPWWLWNIFNHWKSFMMFGSEGNPGLIKGVELFIMQRVPRLLDLGDYPVWIRWVPVMLVIGTVLYGVMFLFEKKRKEPSWYVASALVFLLISILLFTRSKLAWAPAVRYLLPLIPAFAVLLGVGTERLLRTKLKAFAWAPLLLLMVFHAVRLPNRLQEQQVFADFKQEALTFGEMIEPLGVKNIYTMYQVPFANHGLNYVLEEAFVFTDFQRERYGPYSRSMELTDTVGVLNDHGGFSAFLRSTQGEALSTGTRRLQLYYDVKPPPLAVQTLPANGILSITDERGTNMTEELTDSDLETGVVRDVGVQKILLNVRLKTPVELRGIRIPLRENFQGHGWQISSGEQSLMGREMITGYYWSEDRPYYGGGSYRLESRFDPVVVDEFTVLLEGTVQLPIVGIPEIDLLVAPDSESAPVSDVSILSRIDSMNPRGVYADRRMSALLWERYGDDFPLVRDVHMPFAEQPVLDRKIQISPEIPWILPEDEADRTREILDSLGVPFEIHVVDGKTVVEFPKESWDPQWEDFEGLYWAGNRVMKNHRFETAAYMVRMAESSPENADAFLSRALELDPEFQPALALQLERAAPEDREALQTQYQRLRVPAQIAEVDFGKDLSLIGYTMNPKQVVPGEVVQMTYYWRIDPGFSPREWAVFVHFKSDGKIRTQGDHVLLPEVEDYGQPIDQVWQQRKDVRIPDDCPPGELSISLGVYRRTGRGERMKPHTDLDVEFRAVVLPQKLKVNPRP